MNEMFPPEFIQSTAGQIAAELARRGVAPDQRVTVMIGAEELVPGRADSRARVIAAGLTDGDIDNLIKQAQREVEPRLE
jgi:hypothetical protein